MSDDDKIKPLRALDDKDSDILLYDFCKYLATLALLLLGGVLSLTQSGDRTGLNSSQLTVIVALVALGGVAALHGADQVVRSHLKAEPAPRGARWAQFVAMGALGLGTGAFLTTWIEML